MWKEGRGYLYNNFIFYTTTNMVTIWKIRKDYNNTCWLWSDWLIEFLRIRGTAIIYCEKDSRYDEIKWITYIDLNDTPLGQYKKVTAQWKYSSKKKTFFVDANYATDHLCEHLEKLYDYKNWYILEIEYESDGRYKEWESYSFSIVDKCICTEKDIVLAFEETHWIVCERYEFK